MGSKDSVFCFDDLAKKDLSLKLSGVMKIRYE